MSDSGWITASDSNSEAGSAAADGGDESVEDLVRQDLVGPDLVCLSKFNHQNLLDSEQNLLASGFKVRLFNARILYGQRAQWSTIFESVFTTFFLASLGDPLATTIAVYLISSDYIRALWSLFPGSRPRVRRVWFHVVLFPVSRAAAAVSSLHRLTNRLFRQSKLSQEQLTELQRSTHFDKKELQSWYKGMCSSRLLRTCLSHIHILHICHILLRTLSLL